MTRIYETGLLNELKRNGWRKRNKLTGIYKIVVQYHDTRHQRKKQLTVKDNKKYQHIYVVVNNIVENQEGRDTTKKYICIREKEKTKCVTYFDSML